MNELATEEMESSNEPIGQEASGCPLQTMHTQRTVLDADDEIVFPKHKRVATEYSTDESGVTELHVGCLDAYRAPPFCKSGQHGLGHINVPCALGYPLTNVAGHSH
jgi:hypothetical protein